MPARPLIALGAALAVAACAPTAPAPAPPPSAPPPATAGPAARWLDAVEAADTEAAVEALRATVEAAGAEFSGAYAVDVGPYDEPLNLYDTATERVTLGNAPTAAETPLYWRGYSDRLTGGAWDPDAFFADAVEARHMASFNQAYLAAHEAGHALAYYYAVNPRWDRVEEDGDLVSVHCQELLADRVAAAFLRTVEAADARATALRERYLALMASIDAEIPAAQRVAQAGLDGCESEPLLYPSDAPRFQRYVSAFFARQGLLLDGDEGPGLNAVLAEHVLWRRPAFVAGAPDVEGATVTTVAEPTLPTDGFDGGMFGFILPLSRDFIFESGEHREQEASTAVALAPDGAVHVVRMVADAGVPDGVEAPRSAADIEVATTLRVDGAAVPVTGLEAGAYPGVVSAAVVGEGDLVALVLSADLHAEDPTPNTLRLLRLRRAGGAWRATFGPTFPRGADLADSDVVAGPGGALFVASDGRLRAVDLEALAPTGAGTPLDPDLGVVLAVDAEGRPISVLDEVIGDMVPNGGLMSRGGAGAVVVRSGPEGAATLAGSGLFGSVDGPGPRARLGHVVAARAVEGGVLLVEAAPRPRVRRIDLP